MDSDPQIPNREGVNAEESGTQTSVYNSPVGTAWIHPEMLG